MYSGGKQSAYCSSIKEKNFPGSIAKGSLRLFLGFPRLPLCAASIREGAIRQRGAYLEGNVTRGAVRTRDLFAHSRLESGLQLNRSSSQRVNRNSALNSYDNKA